MPTISRRGLLSAAAPLAFAQTENTTGQPNVVILLADDLGWGNVGYHGGDARTPRIDTFAHQGVTLENFYAFPVCSPARSAMMTGRSPMRFGVIYSVIRPWANYGVPMEERFLPQAFQAAGYRTAMTGKWHLGQTHIRQFPNARGFDHFYGHLNGAINYYTHEREGGLDWQRNGESVREEGYSTSLLGAEAVRLIERRDRSRPLFLYVPFNAPHAPLQPPPGNLVETYSKIANPRQRTYAAMVTAMDSAIGDILDALDRERMADNTLVLFFSDNGGPLNEGASNGSLRNGKASTFEGGIRVPAAIRWPGHLPSGQTSSQVMTVLDIFPTLAGAAGIQPGNTLPLDGKNLWGGFTAGRTIPREDLFWAIGPNDAISAAVRRGPWKLVRETFRSKPDARNYLFNLDEDPGERKDLSAQNPELVRDLVAAIQQWQHLHPRNGQESSSRAHPGWIPPKDWARAAIKI